HPGRLVVGLLAAWRPLFRGRLLLVTNTLGCGTLMAAGDGVRQTWERRLAEDPSGPARPIDLRCTARMFAMGCSMGPFLHYGYQWLDKLFPAMGFKDIRTILKKVLIDQLVASPILGVWYFLGMGCLEGQSLNTSCQELQDKFWELYKADWCVWPAAQLVNFLYVPTRYRVMYVNSMTLGWDTYLSYLKHRDRFPGCMGLASRTD
ncbi:mpv17-like protein 2, partial [Trichosurus vulpecula]|uniref:mpv17-like protein 2 n=1 Tax=Trichosurus vulpecula TaxID=9337 RepID=UPI00186AD1CF